MRINRRKIFVFYVPLFLLALFVVEVLASKEMLRVSTFTEKNLIVEKLLFNNTAVFEGSEEISTRAGGVYRPENFMHIEFSPSIAFNIAKLFSRTEDEIGLTASTVEGDQKVAMSCRIKCERGLYVELQIKSVSDISCSCFPLDPSHW